MSKFTKSCHYRIDDETDAMRTRLALDIWKKQNRTGKPSMGEEHRIVIQFAHNVAFPDASIDISTANL
jgi:hypothetical protein